MVNFTLGNNVYQLAIYIGGKKPEKDNSDVKLFNLTTVENGMNLCIPTETNLTFNFEFLKNITNIQ